MGIKQGDAVGWQPIVVRKINSFFRSSIIFALLAQFILGMIQIKAFFSLEGVEYLEFSSTYLMGTTSALFFAFNFENEILAGKWSIGTRNYACLCGVVGIVAATLSFSGSSPFAMAVAFGAFVICQRMFIAWANFARPQTMVVFLIGAAILLGAWLLPLELYISLCIIGLWAAPSLSVSTLKVDATTMFAELRESLLAFSKYLPHTMSGVAIGYLDRYLALNILPNADAEVYMRTLQVISWAAFMNFPVVFYARRVMVLEKKTDVGGFVKLALIVSASFTAVALILLALIGYLKTADIHLPLAAILSLGILFSQFYQILSVQNFVRKRFRAVNMITISSATASLLVAFIVVLFWPRLEIFALVLLVGWGVQFCLTALSIQWKTRTS